MHDELVRFLGHRFVLEHINSSENDKVPSDEITCVAKQFRVWLRERKTLSNKWLSTCAIFLKTAHEILEFVNAYWLGDVVAIKVGYQRHAPRAQELRQKK